MRQIGIYGLLLVTIVLSCKTTDQEVISTEKDKVLERSVSLNPVPIDSEVIFSATYGDLSFSFPLNYMQIESDRAYCPIKIRNNGNSDQVVDSKPLAFISISDSLYILDTILYVSYKDQNFKEPIYEYTLVPNEEIWIDLRVSLTKKKAMALAMQKEILLTFIDSSKAEIETQPKLISDVGFKMIYDLVDKGIIEFLYNP